MDYGNIFKTNAELMYGFYFDAVTDLDDDFTAVSSKLLNDVGWNYWFPKRDQSEVNDTTLSLVRERYLDYIATPFLVSAEDQGIQLDVPLKSSGGFSVWMLAQGIISDKVPSALDYKISVVDQTSSVDQATHVFDAAYRNGLDNQIGYNDLGEYYTKAFAHALTNCPSYITAEASIDGNLVGVATGLTKNRFGGLYNVAVHPEHRRKGLGKALSAAVCKELFSNGVETIMLQTESGSKVENAYKDIGFTTRFDTKFFSLV